MTAAPDAVVVGAGIVGAACALALARDGLRVLVLDAGCAAGGATAAAMGHLVVMDDSPAQLALTAWSLALWGEIAADLPADCEHDPCGSLWLAADDAEMTAVRAKAATYQAHGLAAEVLDPHQLAAAEPELRPGLAGALHVPGDRVLYPPNAARYLLARAADRGAELRQGCPVLRLGPGHVETPTGRLAAGLVVNAAGAAAAHLTPGLPIAPRKGHLIITDRHPGFCRHQLIELGYLKSAHGDPHAGHAAGHNLANRIAVHDRDSRGAAHSSDSHGNGRDSRRAGHDLASHDRDRHGADHDRDRHRAGQDHERQGVGHDRDWYGADSRSGRYSTSRDDDHDDPRAAPPAPRPGAAVAFNVQPRATGQLLIGSSRELAGWDGAVQPAVVARMIAGAVAFLPRLAELSALRCWTGFRPAPPGNLPSIGEWPDIPGVWIAGGHEGLGITTSLATGRLLADLVAGRATPLDCTPFAPARAPHPGAPPAPASSTGAPLPGPAPSRTGA